MATSRFAITDGFSALYVPEINEIWRDSFGSSSSATWFFKHINIGTESYGIDQPLGRRTRGGIMRRDPTTGWIYIPTIDGTSGGTQQKYLTVVEPGLSGIGDPALDGVDAFQFPYWNMSPTGQIWSRYTSGSFSGRARWARWNHDGTLNRYFDADLHTGSYQGHHPLFTPGGSPETPDGRIWLQRVRTISGAKHFYLERYDISEGGTWVDGDREPEFSLDLTGVPGAWDYDAANNCIWFLFNPTDYVTPFFGRGELKRLDLATDTVTATVTMPEAVALDSTEFEIVRVSDQGDGLVWVVNEITPAGDHAKLYAVDAATNTVVQDIALAPYEEDACFGGHIAYVSATDVWHGDAGCGFLYRTPYVGAEVPCEGPPENPYPHDPPPNPPPDLVGRWRWKNGTFRLITDRWKWRNGMFVKVSGVGVEFPERKWKNGAWRDVSDPAVENPPPWDGPGPPPFSDPCNELEPPTDPPDVTLEPLATRVFLCGQMPASRIGLFTCASRAMWNGSLDEATQAAALGGFIQTTQGGYSQYLVGGVYSAAAYDNVIDLRAALLNDLVARPNYAGHQFTDDWASSVKWPPDGISVAEMNHQTAYLLAAVPLIRPIARARPRQWHGSPGTEGVDYPSGIWGVMCQYSYWANSESPAAFAAAEVALARARGWFIQLVINLTDGGSTRGTFMTPSEVETALVAFADPDYADVLAGTGVGFTYNGSGGWLDDPDYQNALATGRNALAAL